MNATSARSMFRLPRARAVAAIAWLAARSAVRARLVLCLLALLLVSVFGLPLAIKGDGSAAGAARVLLLYSLGTASLLLAAVTLWAACAAVAREMAGKQLQLVAVKPVRPLEVWLGKWLGVVGLAGLFLLLAGVVTTGQLLLAARGEDGPAWRRDALAARLRVLPRNEEVETMASRVLADMVKADQLPEEGAEAARRGVVAGLKAARNRVAAGHACTWSFPIPPGRPVRGEAVLSFRFFSFERDQPAVSGRWDLRDAAGRVRHTEAAAWPLDGVNRLRVPGHVLPPGEAVSVVFTLDRDAGPRSVLFHPEHDPELLLPYGSFAGNMARALSIVWAYLALLAALGLTCGAGLSFPVATFTASAMVIMCLAGHGASAPAQAHGHAGHAHEAPAPPGWLRTTCERFAAKADAAIDPFLRFSPLDTLASGIAIPPADVLRALALLALAGPAVLAGVGVVVLGRRELALPAG